MSQIVFRFLIICFLFSSTLTAQLYIPVDTISTNQKALQRYFAIGSKKIETDLKSFSHFNKKYFKTFKKGREELLEELTKDPKLLHDNELVDYLNQLIRNISKENSLPHTHRIFISRETDPNASSLGEGNFIINISLLSRLENEEQLYIVLGHEMAHYHLEHLYKGIRESMKTINSEEYLQKKKEIKKSKYNRFSRSMEAYKELSYGSSKIRRQRELEADSMGYELVKNFLNNPENAVRTLEKIDTLSPSEVYKIDPAILEEHFSTPDLPFQHSWTKGYDFSKYNYRRGEVNIFGYHRDSLSSHPELEERLIQMKRLTESLEKKEPKTTDTFLKLKEKIDFEAIYAHYCMEEYGRGIYYIIQLQHLKTPSERESLFYNYMLSLFYKKLAAARKSFTFKKYIDEVNTMYFSEEYNLFLTILDHLQYSDLKALSDNYKTP